MKCDTCKAQMAERVASRENPYHYDLSGVEDVYLTGITVRECPKCHVELPIVPRMGELHRAITQMIIYKPTRLRGDEIRFLRRELNFTVKDFSTLLGMSREHLSRVENGKTRALSRSADRLARITNAHVLEKGEDARDLLLRVAGILGGGKRKPVRKPLFRLGKRGWKVAA